MHYGWVVGLLVGIGVATPAKADEAGWQATRWGMTVDEAAAASGAAAYEGTDKDVAGLRAALVMLYRVRAMDAQDVLETEATLLFDGNQHLAQVHVSPLNPDEDCTIFAAVAGQTYGDPDRHKQDELGLLDEWRDIESGNLVTLFWTGQDSNVTLCSLNYEPLPQRNAEGGL